MLKSLRPMLGVTVMLWLLVGLGYPMVMTAVSNLTMPWQSQGSPVYVHGQLVGAAHVGQNFKPAKGYFWGRPSATLSLTTGKPQPYNAVNSAPSNLGPTNAALIAHIKRRIAYLEKTTPRLKTGAIPANLVESSGSGLDPDISVAAALVQVPRVARATGLSRTFLTRLVQANTLPPDWGVLGRSRINVLELNIALYRAVHG